MTACWFTVGGGSGVQKSLTRKIPKLSWKLSFGSSSEVPADFSSGSVSYFFSSSLLGSKTTISSESISMTLHIPVRGWTFFTRSHWFLLQSLMNILLWHSMASSFCLQSLCLDFIAIWKIDICLESSLVKLSVSRFTRQKLLLYFD